MLKEGLDVHVVHPTHVPGMNQSVWNDHAGVDSLYLFRTVHTRLMI